MPDISNWPIWAILSFSAITALSTPLKALIPTAWRDFFADRADRREHGQLRESWREEQIIELLQKRDSWLYEGLEKRLDGFLEELKANRAELVHLKLGRERTNSLLTTSNVHLAKITDLLTNARKTD